MSGAYDDPNNPRSLNSTNVHNYAAGKPQSPWEEWPGSGVNANTPMNLGRNAIGFDGDRLLHEYTGHDNNWILSPTGLTKDEFLGL